MWLSPPVYEALPTAYVIIGALLLGGVYYVGFHGPMSFVYSGLGVVSVLAGIAVRQRRNQARRARADQKRPVL